MEIRESCGAVMINRRGLLKAAAGMLAVGAAAGLPATAPAAQAEAGDDAFVPEPGVQYVKLEKPIADWKEKLVKVFSYDCRFCYRYDVSVDPRVIPPVLAETGLSFYPVHLETKGEFGRTASEFFAMSMLRDQKAGRSMMDKDALFNKVKTALFLAYHREEERWPAGESAFIATMAKASGISAEEFARERRAKAVQQLSDAWKVSYDVAKIQGIPAFVINGRYLVLNKSLRNAESLKRLMVALARMP